MTIHTFPVSFSTARHIRAHLRKVRPDSDFEITGKGDSRYVKETHADGYIEMHGKSPGYGKVVASSARKPRKA